MMTVILVTLKVSFKTEECNLMIYQNFQAILSIEFKILWTKLAVFAQICTALSQFEYYVAK